MKENSKIILFIIAYMFFTNSYLFAQGKLFVETNKTSYNYGEPIIVTVTILNDSDTSFTIWGSSSCRTNIGFDTVSLPFACTTDYSPLMFPKYSSQSWVWELDPSVLGIPTTNGEHIIYGYSFQTNQKDSVVISAPKYYGGYIEVNINKEATESEIQLLKNNLGATIISSWTSSIDSSRHDKWQIFGHSIDSLALAYQNDSGNIKFAVERNLFTFDSSFITSSESEIIIKNEVVLDQNYPNPFNPKTTISYFIPEASFVTLKIYDVLGREIITAVNEEQTIGNYKIDFYGDELSSGIYFYQIKTKNYIETKKMLLLK